MNSTRDIRLLPRYVFWDVHRECLDPVKDKHFIVSRMFERANLDDVFSLIVYYGVNETGEVLKSNKHLNRQGLFLAHALLGIPLGDFKAYVNILNH